jgi:alkyl sulfatase BDS1-like metallo-beta-lactamase superfamily hydrolase
MNTATPVTQADAIGHAMPGGMSDTINAEGNGVNRRTALLAGAVLAASLLGSSRSAEGQPARTQTATPKPPSEFTKAANRRVLQTLPFNDRTDFEFAQRGFIAEVPGNAIKDAQGKVVLDLKTCRFRQMHRLRTP